MDPVSECFAEIRHNSSSIKRNILHLSFKTKYYHDIFNFTDAQKRCEKIFREIYKKHRWILREIGFDKDHVHIIINAGIKGFEYVTKALKGTSGKKLLKEFLHIKKTYFWRSGFWSPTIFLDSLGGRTIDDMDEYARNQRLPRDYSFKPGELHLDDSAS